MPPEQPSYPLAYLFRRQEAGTEYETIRLEVRRMTNDSYVHLVLGEVHTPRLHLDGNAILYKVFGLPKELATVHLASMVSAQTEPVVIAAKHSDDLSILNVIDGVDYTDSRPLRLYVSRRGIEYIQHATSDAFVVTAATESDKGFAWYHQHHYPRPGAQYIIPTHGLSAILDTGSVRRPRAFAAQAVEFIRSPWMRREISYTGDVEGVLASVFPQLDVEWHGNEAHESLQAHVFTGGTNYRFLTVGSGGFMRNLDTKLREIVLGRRFTSETMHINPFPGEFMLSHGVMDRFGDIRDIQTRMTLADLPIMYAQDGSDGTDVLVVIQGGAFRTASGYTEAVAIRSDRLYRRLYNKASLR